MNEKLNNKEIRLGDVKNDLLLSVHHGTMTMDTAYDIMQDVERKYYLSMHKYAITHSKTGYWMTYLPNDKVEGGRIKKRAKSQEEIEDIVIDYWRSHTEVLMCQLIPQWIEYKRELGEKRNKFKQQTYDRYMTDYHRFFDDTEMVQKQVSTLTATEVEDFIIERIETLDLTAKAYSGLRTILKGGLNYYTRHHYLSFSPESFFKRLDLRPYFADPKYKTQVFTTAEIEKIKEYIDIHQESIVSYGIMFGFYTGMRIGEISALKWEDVFEGAVYVHRTEERYKDENGEYQFRVRDTPKTTAGVRDVLLTPQAQEIIRRVRVMNPDGEYVFMHEGNRVKAGTYTNKLVRICIAVGIEPRGMHKARKTYASNLFKNKVDEALIISQMGHVDIETTKNFYRYNINEFSESRKVINNAINY